MKSDFNSGDLVTKQKETIDKKFGVLITQDRVHPKFWKVLSNEGVVSWFESNFEKINECKKNDK